MFVCAYSMTRTKFKIKVLTYEGTCSLGNNLKKKKYITFLTDNFINGFIPSIIYLVISSYFNYSWIMDLSIGVCKLWLIKKLNQIILNCFKWLIFKLKVWTALDNWFRTELFSLIGFK